MNKWQRLLITVILLFMVIVAIDGSREAEPLRTDRTEAEQIQSPVVTTVQPIHSAGYSEVTATDQYFFFSYNQDDCVDAYDNSGAYCFTILFPKASKGGFYLGSDGNKLFVTDKVHNCHVFEGSELMESVPSEKAREQGFTWGNVQSRQAYTVTVTKERIEKVGADGIVAASAETPGFIRKFMPALTIPMIVPCVLMVVLLAIMTAIFISARKNKTDFHHS